MCSKHATAFDRKAPGRQDRLAFGARPQTLGDAIDKQIRYLVFAQVALGERLWFPKILSGRIRAMRQPRRASPYSPCATRGEPPIGP